MSADTDNALYQWSSTESNNKPAGSTTVGTNWDDNLRMIQKVVRGWLASKGADIASAATTDLGAVEGLAHDITGTVTITSFGTVSAGIWKVVKFEGVLTLTHNATSLILLTAANRTTADGDVGIYFSEGSGNWREAAYFYAGALIMDTHPLVMGSADRTKKVRLEVDGLTTATTRTITVPDVDLTLPYKPGTYGSMQVYTTAGANTWTKPAGLVRIKVTTIGGGAGGGGAANGGGNTVGGCGAAGGFSIKTVAAASLGSTETATVGAKGSGGAAGNNNGTDGGTSSFGAHCSATGGSKGLGAAASTINTSGLAGVGSNGDINGAGSPGTTGFLTGGPISGTGGSSILGGGGGVVSGSSDGHAAGNYGSGGGGGTTTGAGAAAGGDGTPGIIIVEEFF